MSDITVRVSPSVTRTVTVDSAPANLSSYVLKSQTGDFTTQAYVAAELAESGAYLQSLIQVSSAGVSTINELSGIINVTGGGLVSVTQDGQTIIISGAGSEGDFLETSQSGLFYPASNPDGFITGFNSGLYALKSETGHNHDASYYPLNTNPLGYVNGDVVRPEDLQGFATAEALNDVNNILTQNLNSTGSYLDGRIDALNGVTSLNSAVGALTLTVTGNLSINTEGQSIILSGAGQTGDYADASHNHDETYYPLSSNPNNYITNSQTGTFADINHVHDEYLTGFNSGLYALKSETGHNHDNLYYPLSSNPSNYVTGDVVRPEETGSFATFTYVNDSSGILSTRLESTGSYLYGLINASSAGVSSVNSASGALSVIGAGNITVTTEGQTVTISGELADYIERSETGAFASVSHTHSDYLTGFNSGAYVLKSETGDFASANHTHSEYLTGFNSGLYALKSETGHNHDSQYYPLSSNPSNYLTGFNSGAYALKSETGHDHNSQYYPLNENPSNYITASQTGGFGGGETTINNTYHINSGSGIFFFRKELSDGVTEQFINYPTTLDERPLVLASIHNDISNNLVAFQISGANTTGFWALLSEEISGTGYYLDIFASNSNSSGMATNVIINQYEGGIEGAITTGDADARYYSISNPSEYSTSGNVEATGSYLNGLITGQDARIDAIESVTGNFVSTLNKSMFLESPEVGDRIAMFWTNEDITLSRVKSVVWTSGSSPSTTYKITQSPIRNGASGIVLSATETNQTTGTSYTSFINATITGGNYVFFECTAVSNTDNIHVTLEY